MGTLYSKFSGLSINVLSAWRKPDLLEALKDVRVIAPERVKLCCKMYLGRPAAKVKWYRNGKKICSRDKYRIKRDGDKMILIIDESIVKDSATYRCKATNKYGKVHSKCDVVVLRTSHIIYLFIYLFIYK